MIIVLVTATRIIISSQTIHVNGQPDHDVEPLLSAMRKVKMKVAAIPSMPWLTEEMIDDCAIPFFDVKPKL